jgi:cyclase
VGGRTALLTHVNNAHMDGDTAGFADADMLVTGDVFINSDRYPMIDFGYGGDIRGMISANDVFLALANDNTMIVSSRHAGDGARPHGGIGCRGQERALTAKPFADLDGKWAANEQGAANFICMVYNSFKPF